MKCQWQAARMVERLTAQIERIKQTIREDEAFLAENKDHPQAEQIEAHLASMREHIGTLETNVIEMRKMAKQLAFVAGLPKDTRLIDLSDERLVDEGDRMIEGLSDENQQ